MSSRSRPAVFASVTWVSWRGASVCHALTRPDAEETLCGHQPPERAPNAWTPRLTVHLAADRRRCSRCLRLAGQYADPPAPRPGEPSAGALQTLAEIRTVIETKGECWFHRLSEEWTKRGHEGLGLHLRELGDLGLVDWGHDLSGLVSTLEIIDPERTTRLLDHAPAVVPIRRRSRLSPLAKRSRVERAACLAA